MFFASDGARIFSFAQGEGPDLILLHPTPVHHGFWMPIVSELSNRYRITLLDLRGHGQSELGPGTINMERLGEDVEQLLDLAGMERAVFVGCSIGAYLLYEIWRRMPRRVQALGFFCGKPQPDAVPNRAKRWENIESVRANGTAGFFDQAAANLVSAGFRRREPAKVVELRSMMDAMTSEAVIAIQRCLMERPDSVPILPGISVPVLALAAAEDEISTPAEMRVLSESIPGVEFHLLPECGHYAPFEQPALVSGILRRFLDRVAT